MNEMIAAAKGFGGKGVGYSKMKKQWTGMVRDYALSAGINRPGPFEGQVRLCFLWRERNMKRDMDNIAAAKKFILDGLVEAKVIVNDGWKHVHGFEDAFSIMLYGPVGVEVTIISV
jgi:hypothetical protein